MEKTACLKSIKEAFDSCGVSLDDTLLLGLSGGPDSVALLDMLLKLGANNLTAAHLNHQIRAGEADEDAAFVRELCLSNNIALLEASADVVRMARQSGMCEEEAARDARYAFLRREAVRLGGAYILTAHHRDDQAETVLLNLLRGSALRGLCGMRMLRDGLLRPMLRLSRAQIMAYINEEGLAYRTDSTNTDTRYKRNHIRLKLIPALEGYNTNVKKALAQMGETLSRDEDYLQAVANDALNKASIKGAGGYKRSALLELPGPIRSRALRAIAEGAGAKPDKTALDRLEALLSMASGRSAPLGGGLSAFTEYDALVISKTRLRERSSAEESGEGSAIETPLILPGETRFGKGCFNCGYVKSLRRDEGAYVAYMDAHTLPNALMVRLRRPGDRFHPLGAPGSRKLKQYLIDKKMPMRLRDTPLIADGAEVLFFPGGTVSQHVRVGPDTKRILRVEYSFNE